MSSDRQNYMITPENLYEKIGFSSVEKMKDYGRLIDKVYTEKNTHEAYEKIFNANLDQRYQFRERFLESLKPKTIKLNFLRLNNLLSF